MCLDGERHRLGASRTSAIAAWRAGFLLPNLTELSSASRRPSGSIPGDQSVQRPEPVAGETEGVDLNFGGLAGMEEADIAVRHHGLDLKVAVERYDRHQLPRRRHHAADRVNRELLHLIGT
jgi:hypothetical protein